jgi:pyridoxine/pyridoxamine 5'-phosphate oxidase
MDYTFKVFRTLSIIILLISITTALGCNIDQNVQLPTLERDVLLSVAREYMQTVHYCALVTVDSNGQPHVRAMDPFFPDENMIVYLGTNPKSRKVQEIRNNPKLDFCHFLGC